MSALVIICLMIGIVHSFTVLLILRALQGVFAASFSPVVMTYTTETYPRVKRVTAISFISTSFMLSGVLGQNMSELVVSYLNWQWVYFILTILYLILVLVIYKMYLRVHIKILIYNSLSFSITLKISKTILKFSIVYLFH